MSSAVILLWFSRETRFGGGSAANGRACSGLTGIEGQTGGAMVVVHRAFFVLRPFKPCAKVHNNDVSDMMIARRGAERECK
jgi:hypothetical protein